jgi:hypothetical protein
MELSSNIAGEVGWNAFSRHGQDNKPPSRPLRHLPDCPPCWLCVSYRLVRRGPGRTPGTCHMHMMSQLG